MTFCNAQGGHDSTQDYSQLMARGSLFRHAFPAGVGSTKNLAFRVLEAWRNWRRPPAEVVALVAGRFQIRFDTS
jgi:hypothetical protein